MIEKNEKRKDKKEKKQISRVAAKPGKFEIKRIKKKFPIFFNFIFLSKLKSIKNQNKNYFFFFF